MPLRYGGDVPKNEPEENRSGFHHRDRVTLRHADSEGTRAHGVLLCVVELLGRESERLDRLSAQQDRVEKKLDALIDGDPTLLADLLARTKKLKQDVAEGTTALAEAIPPTERPEAAKES